MSSKRPWIPPLKHVFSSADEAWQDLLSDVLRAGTEVNPRGLTTLELVACSRTFSMQQPVVVTSARKLGYRFMPAEAAWILSGSDRVDKIAPYSRRIVDFSDDGKVFFGAYGPRIAAQLTYVVDALAHDELTRQAVINIWRENPPETRDVPCTLNLQFLLRAGNLHVIATMRSSDTWLGWPYDVFNFTMIGAYILLGLRERYEKKLQLGTLTLQAGSQHLYERDWKRAAACLSYEGSQSALAYDPLGPALDKLTCPPDLTKHLWALADRDPHLSPFWLGELYHLRENEA